MMLRVEHDRHCVASRLPETEFSCLPFSPLLLHFETSALSPDQY